MNNKEKDIDNKMEQPNNSKKECAVCYEELTVDNSVNTPCKHTFCSKCFFKWLKESNTCPLCRNNYTRYQKWDYENINMDTVTHEFSMFRDIIKRTKGALSGHYKKKEKLEKKIKKMNTAVNINNKYIIEKQKSCLRMNKDLEYKRGFYKASHFPISEIDLYNFKYDDEETAEWKNGFQRGFEKKYNCDILNDYAYVIDPFILQARNHLKTLANLSENGISVQKYDSLKNNVYKLVDSLSKYLPKPEFIKLFNNGILKNEDETETIVGMPFRIFNEEGKQKDTYTIHRKVYVDFMYDKNERSWYKTPYYINENNDMCYFDYEVKLNEITDNQEHKFKLERKRKYTDVSNNIEENESENLNTILKDMVESVVNTNS